MPANYEPKTENLEKFVKVCKQIGPIEAILGVPLDADDVAADPELASYITSFHSSINMLVKRVRVAYNVQARGLMERFTKKQQEALMDSSKMDDLQAQGQASE